MPGGPRLRWSSLRLDLFEIIAELAGLDLASGARAADAIELSESAQRRLADPRGKRDDAEMSAHRMRDEDPPADARHRAE